MVYVVVGLHARSCSECVRVKAEWAQPRCRLVCTAGAGLCRSGGGTTTAVCCDALWLCGLRCAVDSHVATVLLQNATRMFGNFGELLDLHASHKIYGDVSEEEEQASEQEEEVRGL